MVRLALALMFFQMTGFASPVIDALKHFNPKDIIKNYTPNPKEQQYRPTEGNDTLISEGLKKIESDDKAHGLYHHIQKREKVSDNPNSTQAKYAEKLLSMAKGNLSGTCQKIKGHCETTYENKSCVDSVSYTKKQCIQKRKVEVKRQTKSVNRRISTWWTSVASISLNQCDAGDWHCTKDSLIKISKGCEDLKVSANYNGYALRILKAPSCKNPSLKIQMPFGIQNANIQLVATQLETFDTWQAESCDLNQNEGRCFLESQNSCIDKNQSRVIDGLKVTRPCWGTSETYQCGHITNSSCKQYVTQGCSHSASECVSQNIDLCNRYQQTFSCPKEVCEREQEVCFEQATCEDGSCAKTENEESTDFAEGITKLGSLVGVADDVYKNQVDVGEARLFTGHAQECHVYIAGSMDCCNAKGWGKWAIHCPKDMQNLLRAKSDGRAVYLGHYHKKKLSREHYAYCVFDTKLAGIIQIQGRLSQLGIGFGSAKSPMCSGLKPEWLESIDFSRLDLSAITNDLTSQFREPDAGKVLSQNKQKSKQLHDKGRPYE